MQPEHNSQGKKFVGQTLSGTCPYHPQRGVCWLLLFFFWISESPAYKHEESNHSIVHAHVLEIQLIVFFAT